MSHLDEGQIVALRDGTLAAEAHRAHADECARCKSALDEARRRAASIATALKDLDEPIDARAAKERLRARLERNHEGHRLPAWTSGHLARAAGLLLVATGAAYALPGSPLRSRLTSTEAPAEASSSSPVATPDREGRPVTGSIAVELADGRLEVVLSGASPGATVEVVWVGGTTARISAAPGSTYFFGEGRAEATVAPGPVRLELPGTAIRLSLSVDGSEYLLRTPDGLEVFEPTQERSESHLRFVTPER